MSVTRKSDKWLMIEWANGGHSIVNLKAVISPVNEVSIGTVVIADKGNGSHEVATIIGLNRDRHQLLEQQIPSKVQAPEVYDEAGPSKTEEPEDFSASASSWEPSDNSLSSDDEVKQKKIKIERFSRSYSNRRSSKVLKPCHRADAVNVNIAKTRKRKTDDTKNKNNHSNMDMKSLPDSTKINNSLVPNERSDTAAPINAQEVKDMKQCFDELFNITKVLNPFVPNEEPLQNKVNTPLQQRVKPEVNNTFNDHNVEEDCDISNRSEDLNRSDDNVLITNKYDKANVLTEKDKNQNDKLPEWIPIGSGKTLLHKDQFRKVNWRSYTIATRTLLLALFPRRILATHSLTGKRSPAFQNKPAKMCLDPKIVCDVIMEITDRFQVKENLVRSIITTKCADECKMYRMRQKQAQKRKTLPAKQNLKMDEDGDANQTC